MDSANIYWWIKCVIFGLAVAAMIIVLAKKSPRFSLMLGRLTSPNMISILHAPIGLIGYFYFYLQGDLMACAILLGISAAMDSVDGQMADVLEFHLKLPKPQTLWQSLFHRGKTELGECIDPAMDKITLLPIYIHIAYGYVCLMLTDGVAAQEKICYLCGAGFIAGTILIDLVGTIIRFDYFKSLLTKSKSATLFGKSKTIAQWLWFMLYPPQAMGWIKDGAFEYSVFLTVLLSGIMALATISLLSKISALSKIFAINKKGWMKIFEHPVE